MHIDIRLLTKNLEGREGKKKDVSLCFPCTSTLDKRFIPISFLLCISYLTSFYFSSFSPRGEETAGFAHSAEQAKIFQNLSSKPTAR